MKTATLVLIICCIFVVLAVAIIAAGILKMRKVPGEKKIGRRVLSVVLCLVLILAGVANAACYHFSDLIGAAFASATATEEEIAEKTSASRDLAEEIEGEAVVLLENKKEALPLDVGSEQKLNVFGQASVNIVYGGAGSGAGNEGDNVNLQTGLQNAGFTINDELTQFYMDHAPVKETSSKLNLNGGDYTQVEPAVTEFSDELLSNARAFSDIAIVVLSRNGGEGGDLPMDMAADNGDAGRHYLELSSSEEALFELVKAQGFGKVIVIVNSSNAMELGFLESEDIDAAIWIGGPGATGCNAVGKVLSGELNPSGRLVDTYAYDITSAPAYYNAGSFTYTNATYQTEANLNAMTAAETLNHTFVDYAEGIYVGYRYYETRWIDNATGLCDEAAYRAAVQYPFGYGLSYTSFDQKMGDLRESGGDIAVDVTVTNTGSVPGKDVAQLYFTAPYTVGGIEKAHVVLAAFGKTGLLAPGASETLTLTFHVDDMASYDYAGAGCYVLEAGGYEIKLMDNAHDVIDSRTYTVDADIVYGETNARSTDLTAAVNQFDDVSFGSGLSFVSRADWEGTLPKARSTDREASQEIIDRLGDDGIRDDATDTDIRFADNGLELADMAGLSYDDPKWEQLLEQISVEDMVNLAGSNMYMTVEIDSINKPQMAGTEGPAGVNSFMSGISGVQFPSAVAVASTWNTALALQMGRHVGDESIMYGFAAIMGPAMNIHRTPFSGRNFEYYSEDGFLSGMMGANVIQGLNEKGVTTFIKHFALNDQETNRLQSLCVWANEQAMRELYLKPFELSVKIGGTKGIMSSFNRIGTTWTGGHYGLLTVALRHEWGFTGAVISDMAVTPYQNPDLGVRMGNDMMLSPTGTFVTEKTTGTNTGRQALRTATHNILYSIANSNALDIVDRQTSNSWLFLLGGVDVAVLAIAVLGFYGMTRKKKETANA